MPTSSILPKPNTIPPPLPPSVEQAYRQKCIDLKRRMNEVEETNDAYRIRKVRLNRGIMKLRLERAFLLEQLTERTAERVDDSDGSPSPPPTPQDKPLRLKRGHRRSGANDGGGGNSPSSTTMGQDTAVVAAPNGSSSLNQINDEDEKNISSSTIIATTTNNDNNNNNSNNKSTADNNDDNDINND